MQIEFYSHEWNGIREQCPEYKSYRGNDSSTLPQTNFSRTLKTLPQKEESDLNKNFPDAQVPTQTQK